MIIKLDQKGGDNVLTVKEIAKKFKVSLQTVYNAITDIEIKKGIRPRKQGRRLIIDDEYYQIIKRELERKGYYEKVRRE